LLSDGVRKAHFFYAFNGSLDFFCAFHNFFHVDIITDVAMWHYIERE